MWSSRRNGSICSSAPTGKGRRTVNPAPSLVVIDGSTCITERRRVVVVVIVVSDLSESRGATGFAFNYSATLTVDGDLALPRRHRAGGVARVPAGQPAHHRRPRRRPPGRARPVVVGLRGA